MTFTLLLTAFVAAPAAIVRMTHLAEVRWHTLTQPVEQAREDVGEGDRFTHDKGAMQHV